MPGRHAFWPIVRRVWNHNGAERNRVLLVELPRRGAFGGADSPELTRRVQSALASLGGSGSVVLAGHSRGAAVAGNHVRLAKAVAYIVRLRGNGGIHLEDVDGFG